MMRKVSDATSKWLEFLRLRLFRKSKLDKSAGDRGFTVNLDAPNLQPMTVIAPYGTLQVDAKTSKITTSAGIEHVIHANGDRETFLPVLQRVEIADLSKIERHNINRVHQTTSHVLQFVGGGVLSMMYDDDGVMAEVVAERMHVFTSNDGVIRVFGTAELAARR